MIDARIARILLARHGETEWNRESRMQGHLDSPLTALGRAQAEALAAALGAEGITALVSSDLGRAVDTARSIAATCSLEVLLDPQLRERHFGVFQGLTWQELQARHPAAHAALQARHPDFVPPGGESLRAFHARVVEGLTRIAERSIDGRVAVVAHGGVVGVMYRHVQSIPLDAPRDYALPNASLNRFRFAGGRWHLEAWGDVSHLASVSLDAADAGPPARTRAGKRT